MQDWKNSIIHEIDRRLKDAPQSQFEFPLMDNCFDQEEILAGIEVMLSGQLTMSKNVTAFEETFAQKVNAPFAVMVNSGSSANLLAVAALINPLRKSNCKKGDEVLLPAVCWSTSLWPLVQLGLKPVFVDVDPMTLNMDLKDAEKKITPKTTAILTVHILGNSPQMSELSSFVDKHQLFHIEDTCESLGSTYKGQALGTFGDFGCYSFYYSHHLTTGEGGMVVCKTLEDVDLLKSLRAHGWTRNLSNKAELEAKYSEIDPRFLFVNSGFNLRPTDLSAAIGLVQLSKMDQMNSNRVNNFLNLKNALQKHSNWNQQIQLIKPSEGTNPVWFGFCGLLSPNTMDIQNYLSKLTASGVENRPIVSGNFVRQPALKAHDIHLNPSDFPGAEQVHKSGFFIGIHAQLLAEDKINRLADLLLAPFAN